MNKHHLLLSKDSAGVRLLFGRSQVLAIIKTYFTLLHEMTKTKSEKI